MGPIGDSSSTSSRRGPGGGQIRGPGTDTGTTGATGTHTAPRTMSVACLSPPGASLGLGRRGRTPGSRNETHRHGPYGQYRPLHHDASSPRGHPLSSVTIGSRQGYPYTSPTTNSPSPPAAYSLNGWGGERKEGVRSDAPDSSRHFGPAHAGQSHSHAGQFEHGHAFPLISTSESQFLPTQLDQTLFLHQPYVQPQPSAPGFNSSLPFSGAAPWFDPLAQPQFHQGGSPQVQQSPPYPFSSQSFDQGAMGGGPFHPSFPTTNRDLPLGYPSHSAIPGQAQGGGFHPVDPKTGEDAAMGDSYAADPMNQDILDLGPESVGGDDAEDRSTSPEETQDELRDNEAPPLGHSVGGKPLSRQRVDSDTDPKAGSKRRTAFDPVKRKQTAETRKNKACIRCRVQRKRVSTVPLF